MDIAAIDTAAFGIADLAWAQGADAASAESKVETMLFETLLRSSNLLTLSESTSAAFGTGMYEQFLVHEFAKELASQHSQFYGRALLGGLETKEGGMR